MATIQLSALGHANGPMIPSELAAWLKDRVVLTTGGTVPVLCLGVGMDTLEIWPADPARIEALAAKLEQLARKLRGAKL